MLRQGSQWSKKYRADPDRGDAEQRRLEAEAPSSDFDCLVESGKKLIAVVPEKPARDKNL